MGDGVCALVYSSGEFAMKPTTKLGRIGCDLNRSSIPLRKELRDAGAIQLWVQRGPQAVETFVFLCTKKIECYLLYYERANDGGPRPRRCARGFGW
jgi:hypothetical protein